MLQKAKDKLEDMGRTLFHCTENGLQKVWKETMHCFFHGVCKVTDQVAKCVGHVLAPLWKTISIVSASIAAISGILYFLSKKR